jgi:hypothetical protein
MRTLLRRVLRVACLLPATAAAAPSANGVDLETATIPRLQRAMVAARPRVPQRRGAARHGPRLGRDVRRLAEALGAVLVTTDGRLGEARGPTGAIEVIAPER